MDVEPGRRSVTLDDGPSLSLVEHAPAAAEPDAPPFVLVHGLSSNARTWDGVGQALAAAGRQAWAVDLRGHGRSDKPDDGYDIATVARDVCELIDQLSPSSVVLAGQSWGGNVVMEAAARCPERIAAVAGVDGGAIRLRSAFPTWEGCARQLAPPPLAGTPASDMERYLRAAHPDWPESGISGTMANFEVRDDGTVAPWLTRERHMRVLRGLWEHDPLAIFPSIARPALLIAAGPSDAGPPAATRRQWFTEAATRLPAGRLVELPDADHDVHAQHPDDVATLLQELAATASSGPGA